MYSELRVATAPETEPCELDLVRRHCRVDSTYDDDLLTMYEIAARQWAENWLNRALITQELVYTITNAPPPYAAPLVPQSLLVLPLGWPAAGFLRPITLPRGPCQSLTAVQWGNIGDLEAAETNQYTLNAEADPATVMVSAAIAPMTSSRSLQFQFKAGYGDAPADVPAPIRAAILLLTAFLYEGRGDVNSPGPDAAWSILAGYRIWHFAG